MQNTVAPFNQHSCALSQIQLKNSIDKQGMLWLRHPKHSQKDFLSLSNTWGKNFIEQGTGSGQHPTVGGNHGRQTLKNTPGLFSVTGKGHHYALPLHGEGYFQSKTPPELLWFYCQKASKKAQPTWIVDGQDLFQILSPQTQKLFLGQNLTYQRYHPAKAWPERYKCNTLRETLDYLVSLGFQTQTDTKGGIITQYTSPALNEKRESPIFVNNFLSFALREYHTKEALQAYVRLEGGEQIPEAILLEIETKAMAIKQDITWQTGDILVIDNHRLMHGRGKLNTAPRENFIRMSARNF